MDWQDRLLEWRALLEWAREQGSQGALSYLGIGGDLKSPERVRAITWTLQKHWQEMLKMGAPIAEPFERYLRSTDD